MANAADARQVSHSGRKAQRARENYLVALKRVLGTPAGRLVFGDLLERAGIYQSVFHPNTGQMCFNEGRRQMGLEVLDDLVTADAALYLTLEAERRARTEADGREAQAYERVDGEGD